MMAENQLFFVPRMTMTAIVAAASSKRSDEYPICLAVSIAPRKR
jgi:hypothetical protein